MPGPKLRLGALPTVNVRLCMKLICRTRLTTTNETHEVSTAAATRSNKIFQLIHVWDIRNECPGIYMDIYGTVFCSRF